MRIYELRVFEKRPILDKNFKWSKRWYLDTWYVFYRKADIVKALRRALRFDIVKSLRGRYKYTVKCIVKKGGAKRV